MRRFFLPLFWMLILVPLAAEEPSEQRWRIHGTLIEAKTSKPLKHKSIEILPFQQEFKSDGNGCFLLNLPQGTYQLLMDIYPYYQKEISITLCSDTILIIPMEAPSSTLSLDEFEVVGTPKLVEQPNSTETLQKDLLTRLPSMAGESDVLKSFALTAGVNTGSEGSVDLQIRGGDNGQNRYLQDDIPLFSTSHLFGLVSAYNPTAIQSATLYKIPLRADYGECLSGIIDVSTRLPSLSTTKAELEVGLLATKAHVQTPLVNEKLALSVAGRLSNYSLLTLRNLFTEDGERLGLFFGDINTKMRWKPSEKDELIWTAYGNSDVFEISQRDAGAILSMQMNHSQWNTGWQWHHRFNNKWTNYLHTYVNSYHYSYGNAMNYFQGQSFAESSSSKLMSYSLNDKATYQPSSTIKIETGLQLSHYLLQTIAPKEQHFWQGATYLHAHFIPHPNHLIELGLRLSGQLDNGSYVLSPEPRLSYQSFFENNWSFSLAGARNTQVLHRLSNPGLGYPFEILLWSDQLKAQESWQLSMGLAKEWHETTHSAGFKAEGWHKTLQHLSELKDGYDAQQLLHTSTEFVNKPLDYLCQGEGWAYGLDASLFFYYQPFRLLFDYAWMNVWHRFDELNQARPFPASSDIRHSLSLTGIYKLSESWSLSANWQYQSGRPLHLPSYCISNDMGNLVGTLQTPILIYEGRNAFRARPFHKLDISLTKQWRDSEKCRKELCLGLYNVYNRDNTFLYFIVTENGQATLKSLSFSSILPSISYRLIF